MSESDIVVKSPETNIVPLIEKAISRVREDMRDSPYIKEALHVLPVRGYRSAIGAFWNAVVDDLRNKILFRSIALFNKEINVGREIKTYEDFQQFVNDDQLIEGAYKIGVIGWEAYKILRHSKEARNIFYGHPASSEPSLVKVLSVIDDCIKYVLNEEYPSQIIDIDKYIGVLGTDNFDRNVVAIENALGDLPETYKNELINRLFTVYIHPDSPSVLISNIEFVAPLLWRVLPKSIKIQVVRRVDQEYPKGNAVITDRSFAFVRIVKAVLYLSHNARKYVVAPIVEKLKNNLDNWPTENEYVRKLVPFSSVIPEELIDDYVWAITHTYVGKMGSSYKFSRTDFYADGASSLIPLMFEKFNDRMALSFVRTIENSKTLKSRIHSPSKIKRLRSLGLIVDEKTSDSFEKRQIIDLLIDESKENEFFIAIKS